MTKDGNQPENKTDKNPAHQTEVDEGSVQRSGNFPKGTDTARGSEGDTRRASKGAR
ncbi:hypothetical protein [Allopontixanthobacter sp.]|uniref:hypothetical protein n=1 Tax=Allopontixanthobacter sp. TaxID=2906452 RepID=UPI002AB84686|nr:hypothetical protein [Allopontixanthobacter sp.]MDZ4306618.1 hypothetical protein [Allopontixanthobacter sp.]